MEKEENGLGTEKIGKLIKKFSIPCIISLVVNSLYNIVDQIFIGWGVGYIGNGATNVVFPIVIICLAFALMFGDGGSSYLSLKLGQQKKKEAEKGVGNSISLSIIVSVVLCFIILIFLPQLINLFGSTDALREYALQYGYIIAIGLPFMIIGTTLSSIIRADGSPNYSMVSMVAGAILNIILDPIFIFVLEMGVKGAAIATVTSQVLTFIINILYLRRLKTVKLNKEAFRLQISVSKKVISLGSSSFITQMSTVIVIAVQNNLLRKYGVETKYGSEIPITVMGIVMKINQILSSIIIGIATGTQPIIGYNYGAKKYDRVKTTIKIALSLSVVISTIAFILFQTIPDKLIAIFGSGDENYIEFACLTFKIFLALCICNGVQIPAGIFFQAIGKSGKSIILSLSRQIIFLVVAMLVLSSIFGLNGVLYAGPVADGMAFILALIVLSIEMKNLEKSNTIKGALMDGTNVNNQLTEHVVITISREYGSGGRYVGELVAKKLGIKLYDKDIIIRAAQETGLSEEYIKNSEQKRLNLANWNNGYYSGLNNTDEIFISESKSIKEIAEKESCVIVGRCADFVLKDKDNVINIFIYSKMKDKVKRATEIYGLDRRRAEKAINKINKERENHYNHYTDRKWRDFGNYDICIDSDTWGVEKTANMICEMVQNK